MIACSSAGQTIGWSPRGYVLSHSVGSAKSMAHLTPCLLRTTYVISTCTCANGCICDMLTLKRHLTWPAWDALVERAKQLGMHGAFLDSLQQIFDIINLAVCVNGVRGEQFKAYRGTKQGSTLSPLCFGMFIEQLHELITMQLPGAGPMIDGMRVPGIMYADDVKLIAVSDPAELQQLLDVLHLFCTLFGMEVNRIPHNKPDSTIRHLASSWSEYQNACILQARCVMA